MKKIHLVALVIGLAIITTGGLLAFALYLNNTRFYMMTSSGGQAYEVDRRTGRTWILRGDSKTEQLDPAAIEPGLKAIPFFDVHRHLTGRANLEWGKLSGSVYNGTDWTVKRIVFSVTIKEEDGTVRWTREYATNVRIPPKSSSETTFDVTGAGDFGSWSWSITEAYGTQ